MHKAETIVVFCGITREPVTSNNLTVLSFGLLSQTVILALELQCFAAYHIILYSLAIKVLQNPFL